MLRDFTNRIKAFFGNHREKVTLALTIAIVSFLSFSLGRLSADEGAFTVHDVESETANAVMATTPS
ncbi:MAG: hypothetical protein AAB923_03855, partial [Patescibacteria group bacterium]